MAYDVILHPRAQRELSRAPSDVFTHVDTAIWLLRENPRPIGVKKLEGDLRRVRIGDWRLIFAIFDHERRVVILRVVRRSENTYRNLS